VALVALAVAMVVPVLAGRALAETRRLAVIVGHNHGSGLRPPLRFAEEDALKMAAVLEELGDFRRGDIFVLRGPTLASTQRALQQAAERVGRWRARPGTQVVAVFYFSGHSDGVTLELGRESLPFAEVRRWMAATGAEVRIGIIDTCKSGALLAVKGGTLAPPFEIRVADNLSSMGDVLITSSAASELALESAAIGASFFSHHLVSGLRGAADISGDGLVTLAEAYHYAFSRTVSATADTIVGTQHPVYDYRLSGRGDVVLTILRQPTAAIDLPPDLDRVVIRRTPGRDVVAEVADTTARRIGLLPGRYQVRGWRRGSPLAVEVPLATGEIRALSSAEMRPAPAIASLQKGGADLYGESAAEESCLCPRLFLGVGAASAVSAEAGPLLGVRLGLRGRGRVRPALVLDLATGRSEAPDLVAARSFTETHAQLLGGVRLSHRLGRTELGAGAFLGGGVATQRSDDALVRLTGLATAAVSGTARWAITQRLGLLLDVQLPATLARLEGRVATLLLPTAWMGLEMDL
jgi:hypothetical protein